MSPAFNPQWIERWFDESPDGGDGSFEHWLVVGAFFVAALIAGMLAQHECAAILAARRGHS